MLKGTRKNQEMVNSSLALGTKTDRWLLTSHSPLAYRRRKWQNYFQNITKKTAGTQRIVKNQDRLESARMHVRAHTHTTISKISANCTQAICKSFFFFLQMVSFYNVLHISILCSLLNVYDHNTYFLKLEITPENLEMSKYEIIRAF